MTLAAVLQGHEAEVSRVCPISDASMSNFVRIDILARLGNLPTIEI